MLALAAVAAGLIGALCEDPSPDCLHINGRTALRAGLVAGPVLAYAWYRITRGKARG